MADVLISDLPQTITPASTDKLEVENAAGDGEFQVRGQLHTLEVGEHLILPQVNEPATPTLAFGPLADMGFYTESATRLNVVIGGSARYIFNSNLLRAQTSSGPGLNNVSSTATVPTLLNQHAVSNTGVGGISGEVSLITGGVEALNVNASQEVTIPTRLLVTNPRVNNSDLELTGATLDRNGHAIIFQNSAGSREGGIGSGWLEADRELEFFIDASTKVMDFGVNGNYRLFSTLQAATGDETALSFNYTINKLTSGIAKGLVIAPTETSVPGAHYAIEVQGGQVLLPNGSAGAPSLAYNAGADGIYGENAGNMAIAINGVKLISINANAISSQAGDGFNCVNESSTATNPTLIPNKTALDTGVGGLVGTLDLITNSLSALNVDAEQHILMRPSAVHAVNNEDLAVLKYTINKAGGNVVGLLIDGTETSVPGTHFAIQVLAGQMVLPQTNDPTAPDLAFGSGDYGFYGTNSDTLNVALSGARHFVFDAGGAEDVFRAGVSASGPAMRNFVGTAGIPVFIPNFNFPATGIGGAPDNVDVIVNGTAEINVVAGAVTIPNLVGGASGKVLQILSGTTSTLAFTGSPSVWLDSGAEVTITPSSASNTIMVFADLNGVGATSSGQSGQATDGMDIRIVRGASSICSILERGGRGDIFYGYSGSRLDTPATTSATTYKIQVKMNGNASDPVNDEAVCQNRNARSTITVMEIAA